MILHMLILYVPALALMFSVRVLDPTSVWFLSAFLSILSNNSVNVSANLHDQGRSRIECRKIKNVKFYTLQRVWIEMLVFLPGHGSNICGVEGCFLAVISGTYCFLVVTLLWQKVSSSDNWFFWMSFQSVCNKWFRNRRPTALNTSLDTFIKSSTWKYVLVFQVILVDELLKILSRRVKGKCHTKLSYLQKLRTVIVWSRSATHVYIVVALFSGLGQCRCFGRCDWQMCFELYQVQFPSLDFGMTSFYPRVKHGNSRKVRTLSECVHSILCKVGDHACMLRVDYTRLSV